MSSARGQTPDLPALTSSVEYQDFIQNKIQNIKQAISRIKSSGDKKKSPINSRISARSCEMTPQASVQSNIQGVGRYDFLATTESNDDGEIDLSEDRIKQFQQKLHMGNGYNSIFNQEQQLASLVPTEAITEENEQNQQNFHNQVIKLRLQLEKQRRKYLQLKRVYGQCKSDLQTSLYDHSQMQEMVNQQKLLFEEYNVKIGQTIHQLEQENDQLKRKLSQANELKNQVTSQKQNMQKVLEEAVKEQQRADDLFQKNKSYKVKLQDLLTQTSEMSDHYIQQRGLLESQSRFIENVLSVCKVQTCAQAVEYLQDIHKKAEFLNKTQHLISRVNNEPLNESVKETWRWLKQLLAAYLQLHQNQKELSSIVMGHVELVDDDRLIQVIQEIKEEARLMSLVRQSGVLGQNIEVTLTQMNQDKLQKQLQNVINERLPQKNQPKSREIEFKNFNSD